MIDNPKKCPRWNACSANICPIDPDVALMKKLPREEVCPFCLKKRVKSQRGVRTLAPDSILVVIPESNIKILHKRNQRRWYNLNKKDGKE